MKKPAHSELESVARIFPPKPAILKDLIVFIPAGAAAPGTRTVVDLGKWYSRIRIYFISIYTMFIPAVYKT
jgi:hypothetical protein